MPPTLASSDAAVLCAEVGLVVQVDDFSSLGHPDATKSV